jgi:hypothetical protein
VDCTAGKMHQHPFPTSSARATRPLGLIHSDLSGPVEVQSLVGNYRYTLTLIDDHTRFAWVYFLRCKSDAAKRICQFIKFVERHLDFKVARLRTDRGGEYLSHKLQKFLQDMGISHELSIPHTPQQNGVAERYNRTLFERARSMLLAAGLPVRFWMHAIKYANWLTNRVPTAALSGSLPYTTLYKRKPTLAFAKVFGCLAQVWLDPDVMTDGVKRMKRKFAPRATWGIFLGISSESKAWEFFLPTSGECNHLSRNAVFYEDKVLKDWRGKEKGKYLDTPVSPSGTEPVSLGSDPFPGLGVWVSPSPIPLLLAPVPGDDGIQGRGERAISSPPETHGSPQESIGSLVPHGYHPTGGMPPVVSESDRDVYESYTDPEFEVRVLNPNSPPSQPSQTVNASDFGPLGSTSDDAPVGVVEPIGSPSLPIGPEPVSSGAQKQSLSHHPWL